MRALLTIALQLFALATWACDACQKQQPKLLKGITHGTGPQGEWDMPIIWVSAVIVVITLILAVKFLVKPNEKNADHIKRSILNNTLPYHG